MRIDRITALFISVLIVIQVTIPNVFAQSYRPQFHFSPQKNWINDPNGLVYFEGEYHLFYQYNPFGDRWGHMTWGHAVSTDLLHWTELPPAIAEEDGVMIFSGCVVIDSLNTAGFGSKAMVAIYTGHEEGKRQTQHIAYSTDRGRTWTKYAQNPVLNYEPEQRDFRDPNVFWYEPLSVWLMTVVLPHEQKALFYHSKNLLEWQLMGDFQVRDASVGIWECPALLKLATPEGPRWLLLISVGQGSIAGGSGMMYFVGTFDGTTFTPQDTRTRWVDYGRDFYAAIPFHNLPTPTLIGWMNNWQYAQEIPTSPFRGQMTLPRELSLTKREGAYVLQQFPTLLKYFEGQTSILLKSGKLPKSFNGDTYALRLKAVVNEDFSLYLKSSSDYATLVRYDSKRQELYLDRSRSGRTDFHKDFPSRTVTSLKALTQKTFTLWIWVDRCSVEIVTEDGTVSMTNLIFPAGGNDGLWYEGRGIKRVEWFSPPTSPALR